MAAAPDRMQGRTSPCRPRRPLRRRQRSAPAYALAVAPPRRLKGFPRHEVIPHELLRCQASELDLLAALGEPTGSTDPHQSEPRFFWDLAWPCGLVTALELSQLTEVLTVHLDQAEVDHALRHLGITPRSAWRWQDDAPAAFAVAVPDPPSADWILWRQGDDGNRVTVAAGLTERDARCRLAELEDGEVPHHHVYGVTRLAPGQGGPGGHR